MHNVFSLETAISGTKTVYITVLEEKVGAVEIRFINGSKITISRTMFQAIQEDSKRKYLKGLRAKIGFTSNPVNPSEIQIGGISGYGLPLRKLKHLGRFMTVNPRLPLSF